jgi:hypothetical protein
MGMVQSGERTIDVIDDATLPPLTTGSRSNTWNPCEKHNIFDFQSFVPGDI